MNPFSLFASLRRSLFVPLSLSVRQAAHEWASALCQCFALSAVVLPILLLIGLKNGIIESEWKRLMNDPDALLLSPRIGLGKYDVTWDELRDINRIPGVHTALPQLSLSHSQVYLDKVDEAPTSGSDKLIQITLTRANDKTLTYYKCPVPVFREGSNEQEAVLNDTTAQMLKARVGDEFVLRPHSAGSSQAPLAFRIRVVGILPPDNKALDDGNRKRIFLAEELGFELMDFIDGFPCSLTGEKLSGPTPLCRSLLLVPPVPPAAPQPVADTEQAAPGTEESATPEPANEMAKAEPILRAAQKKAEALKWSYPVTIFKANRSKGEQVTVTSLPEGSFLLGPKASNDFSWEHMSQVKELLPALLPQTGQDWKLYPWNQPLGLQHLELSRRGDSTVTAPWNSPELMAELSRRRETGRCIIYTGTSNAADDAKPDFSRAERHSIQHVGVMPPGRDGSLATMDIVTVPGLPVRPPQYLCAAEDLCQLSLACYKEYQWDYTNEDPQKAFFFSNRTFGFRCYAASIDDVQSIKDALEGMGFSIKSSAADIAKNRKMDANLQRLLLLIGALAGTGAIIALVFNLFNATERRKKDYAILRTLGLGRLALLTLPVYETAIIMVLTLLTSFGIYHGVNFLMARYLAGDIVTEGGRLCYIPLEQQLLIAAVTLALAVLAALLSSLRLCRLSPAAYIRES